MDKEAVSSKALAIPQRNDITKLLLPAQLINSFLCDRENIIYLFNKFLRGILLKIKRYKKKIKQKNKKYKIAPFMIDTRVDER
jgi:hypothetical protein